MYFPCNKLLFTYRSYINYNLMYLTHDQPIYIRLVENFCIGSTKGLDYSIEFNAEK